MTSDFLHVPLHVLPADSGCVIDCDTCTVRGEACDDCVVGVMLGGPPGPLDPAEHRALAVLAEAGLVPPLQMTPPPAAGAAGPAGAVGPGAPPGPGPDPAPA